MPDGDKGREGKRHGSQSAHRRQNGTSHGDGETEGDTRQAGREERETRMASRLESGGGDKRSTAADREQGENRQTEKKRYINI